MEVYLDLEKTLTKRKNQLSKQGYTTLTGLAQNHKCVILTAGPLYDAKQFFSIPNLKIVSTLENKLYQDGTYKYTPLNTKEFNSLAYDDGIYTMYAVMEKECYILKYQEHLKTFYPTPILKIQNELPNDLAAVQMVVFQKDFQRIMEKLTAYSIEILASDQKKALLNITSSPSSKESWLLQLKESPAIGIGDSLSDYHFIKHCEVQVAMKNADDELKALCQYETSKTNEEDGALDFILSYLKHQQA